MTHFLDILHLFLALLPPALTQTMDAYNSTEEVEEAESFFSSMDFHVSRQSVWCVMWGSISYFQSILIGVVGFWGGVFCMGLLYLLAVLAKRVFKPEEAEKGAEWRVLVFCILSYLLMLKC